MSDVETANPVHEGIVARVEAALKSGALWIEDHFHALLDNIETAIGGGTPTADPTPSDTIANVETASAGNAVADAAMLAAVAGAAGNDATPQAADAGTAQTDAPATPAVEQAVDTGAALASEHAAETEQKVADETPQ